MLIVKIDVINFGSVLQRTIPSSKSRKRRVLGIANSV